MRGPNLRYFHKTETFVLDLTRGVEGMRLRMTLESKRTSSLRLSQSGIYYFDNVYSNTNPRGDSMDNKTQWETPELSHFGDVSELTAEYSRVTKEGTGGDNCFEGTSMKAVSCIA